MKFHTFYTDNILEEVVSAHRRCCVHLGVNVKYHKEKYTNFDEIYVRHGDIMTSVLESANEDEVVCFLDVDCIPHNYNVLLEAYTYAKDNCSFVGNAQNISHLISRNNLYAAASTLMIHKRCWLELGSPSITWFMKDGLHIDTAQYLTMRANDLGFSYRLMYPIGYDDYPVYQLGGYGNYGRGTLYPGTYHWIRMSDFAVHAPKIWSERVSQVLSDQPLVPNHRSIFYS